MCFRTLCPLFFRREGVQFTVDDLVVWGGHVEQHETRLRQVLDCCQGCNLKLKKEKSRFPVSQVRHVGQVLSSGIKLDPQKVEVINTKLTPGNCKDLQRFLGVETNLPKCIPNMPQKSLGKSSRWCIFRP